MARALLGKPRRPTAFTPRHLRLVQGSRSLFSSVPVLHLQQERTRKRDCCVGALHMQRLFLSFSLYFFFLSANDEYEVRKGENKAKIK